MNFIKKIIGLIACRRFDAPKVVGTTNEAIVSGTLIVFIKCFVELARSFCALHNDEANGISLNHSIGHLLPVDVGLIMRDINAVDFIAFGIFSFTIKRTPTEAGWSNKEMIKAPNVDRYHTHSSPCNGFAREITKGAKAFTCGWLPSFSSPLIGSFCCCHANKNIGKGLFFGVFPFPIYELIISRIIFVPKSAFW